MTTLKPFDNLLAIEVPIDATHLTRMDDELWYYIGTSGSHFKEDVNCDFKILGCVTPTEIDFDCSSIFIVSTSAVTKKDYKIYLNEQSLRSLLSYNGIEIKEEYKLVILEKQ